MSLDNLTAAKAEFVSILQLTDMHVMADPEATLLGIKTDHYFNAILHAAFAAHSRFDLILLTGDLSQDESPASYQRILASIEARNTPCICLPGNHDDPAVMERIFDTPMVQCRRQVAIGQWQVVMLNSRIPGDAAGHIANGELAALEQALQTGASPFVLVAVHHHCVPSQSSWMDTMIIDNRQEFLGICQTHASIKGIVAGHIHQALDTTVGALRILATPSTCFQFTPKTEAFSLDTAMPGYRVLRLHSDGRFETEVFRLPGQLTELKRDAGGY